jgi:hypothetical protein
MACGVSAAAADPILALCAEYHAAHKLCDELASRPGGGNYDTPEIEGASARAGAAFRAISRLVPQTLEGVAAMATVLIAEDVNFVNEASYSPEDWLKVNLARGARALTGGSA